MIKEVELYAGSSLSWLVDAIVEDGSYLIAINSDAGARAYTVKLAFGIGLFREDGSIDELKPLRSLILAKATIIIHAIILICIIAVVINVSSPSSQSLQFHSSQANQGLSECMFNSIE